MLSQEPTSQYHNPACLFHFAMISTWYISPQLEGLASCYPPPPFFCTLSLSLVRGEISLCSCVTPKYSKQLFLRAKWLVFSSLEGQTAIVTLTFPPNSWRGFIFSFNFFFTIPIIVKTMPKVPIMFATVGHISNFDWFSICEPDMVLLSLEKIRVKFVTCVYTSPNRWKHHTECTQVPINRIPLTCFSSQPAV